jgi:hypothetical protein
MYTNFSIQNIASIEAHAFLDLESTPVIINFDASEAKDSNGIPARAEITLHFANRELAAALVEAINTAAKVSKPNALAA